MPCCQRRGDDKIIGSESKQGKDLLRVTFFKEAIFQMVGIVSSWLHLVIPGIVK